MSRINPETDRRAGDMRGLIFTVVLCAIAGVAVAVAQPPPEEVTCGDYNRSKKFPQLELSRRIAYAAGTLMRPYLHKRAMNEPAMMLYQLDVACALPAYDTVMLIDVIASFADPHWFVLGDCSSCSPKLDDHHCHPAEEVYSTFDTPELVHFMGTKSGYVIRLMPVGNGIWVSMSSSAGGQPDIAKWYSDPASCEAARRAEFGQ
jgi:hypothetical protein